MISIAVAVALRDIITAACVNRTKPVADPALIVCTDTVVFIITIPSASASATQSHHRQVRQAGCHRSRVAFWYVGTSTLVNLSRTIAHATGVEFSDTRVYVIADAISIFVRSAIATAHTKASNWLPRSHSRQRDVEHPHS